MWIYDNTFILIYVGAVSFLLGAVMGSFLNCAAYRIAHNESFIKGRSHCTSCGHSLSVPDLVPIFSYIFLKGKCRYCGAKLSVRYPITELVFALMSLGLVLEFGITLLCLRNFILICCLFCLSIVDIESYTIPNGCLIIPAAAWAAYLPFSGMEIKDMLLHVLAGFVFGAGLLAVSLVLDKIMKKETMGGGDIKLIAVVGLYFGFAGSLFALIISCVLGLLTGALMKFIFKNQEKQIPFGPSISAAACFMLYAGSGIVEWYVGLIS